MTEKLLIYVIGGVISSMAALVIGAAFGDKIKLYLGRLLASLSEVNEGIEDDWVADFTVYRGGQATTYTEIIRIKYRLGVLFGAIEPDDRNHNSLKAVQTKRPLRLRGEVKDNIYFTGYWYHPIETARYHGAFQLVIHPDGKAMSGKWVGYSETLHQIDSGAWSFKRIQ